MQALTLLTFVAVTCCSYLTELHVLPKASRFLPEVLSGLIGIRVILNGMGQRFRDVAPKYWLLFASITFMIFCGILSNGVGAGPQIGGLRYSLRALPLFFLPAVVTFTEAQLRQQLQLLLAISIIQLPLAGYQRLTIFQEGRFTGDPVFGTLMLSGVMSLFQIGVVCTLTGLFVRRRITLGRYVMLFLLVLLPTTINETKVTLLLLPIGLLATVIIGAPPGTKQRVALGSVLLMVAFGALFVPIYDYFNTRYNPYPVTLGDFFGNSKKVETYMENGAGVGSRKEAGRVDAIEVPLERLSRDPVKLVFGLGIGNASNSNLGPQFTGEYYGLYGRYTIESSTAAFLLEMGVGGVLLVLVFMALIFGDSLAVAREGTGLTSALAVGWAGITLVTAISLFYLTLHTTESLSYLFFYFSGLVAAARMRLGTT
ncbi:MAG TPA: hypothetical protein VHB68_12285 [Steroidobacteraceae bacterium]|nr:hypothetical protein [Steroidobacteraceae bacterium]